MKKLIILGALLLNVAAFASDYADDFNVDSESAALAGFCTSSDQYQKPLCKNMDTEQGCAINPFCYWVE